MQESDYDSFVVLLDSTAMVYNGKDLPHTVIQLWWDALSAYDLVAVREGFNRHLQNPDTGQFMPKPADIVRMLGGTTQDGALQAWSKVDQTVRGIGTYESVVFDDPIIHAVIADMGGWIALGGKTEKDWPFVAREFETRYRGYRMRARIDHYPPVLVGITQTQNEVHGFPAPKPILVGNKQQAMLTRQHGMDKPQTLWHRAVSEVPKPKLLEVHMPDAVESQDYSFDLEGEAA